ncbi:MAG: N-6 DNA methylase [Polyangiaceae bacterium]|nr:N-6 DNA methylase [Polyangiaceae bacterium]
MVQPIEGLVVSVPVLVEAQCIERQTPEVQQKLSALCPAEDDGSRAVRDLGALFSEVLGLTPDLFDVGEALPDDLCLYVPEGRQTIRPTMALRKLVSAPAAVAGERYVALVWDVAAAAANARSGREPTAPAHPGPDASAIGLDLDKPETLTGPWEYPAAAKLDRLLRQCRVPIGILTNREVVRLVYAPHGESSGHITFRIDDMTTVGGRPILDAFVMLLSATRFFGVAEEHALPALLAESRKRQANVTNELAEQVFDALQILLHGFEAAAERDGRDLLDDALARGGDHLYKGLLTVLLRLVFLLYAEDRGLLPIEQPVYAEHMSVLGLFDELREDAGAHPDSMSRRFGAWGALVALFRAIYLGVEHGALRMPARRGALFDPHTYPFLEGWGPAGGAPIVMAEDRAAVRVPTVDDETVFRALEKLIVFEGQRLSYRTLDVEQIGSVYEALMGYHVLRCDAQAVCMRPNGIWLTAAEVVGVPASRRAKWLKDELALSAAQADKLASGIEVAKGEAAVLDALGEYGKGRRRAKEEAFGTGAGDGTWSTWRAKAGQLVLQPGSERRRTSSHYTPRSLSAPIVRRTLEPLLACMGPEPASERILHLKVCDPAMGSGAFLVEACRFLGDALLAAWTREGKLDAIAGAHDDPVLHARRMVAQRCLYGVDKNDAAVELAKLSLWLVTLAKELPFTFLDHALRHGDSLVGLSFDQIRAFHWKPEKQVTFAEVLLREALDEAISIRQQILELASEPTAEAQREKERLLADAADACDRARLIADLVVGAFFGKAKDKEREEERRRRLVLVERWLAGDAAVGEELRALQAEIRARLPIFHWMLEFPEVFYAERPDPLDDARVNRAAYMDAFVGNPPFLGGMQVSGESGASYGAWLPVLHEGASGNADLSAHFFRRAHALLGAHGTIGLIATNTIAQGDTRETALKWLVQRGALIFDATRTMRWPGSAAVAVAVVHVASGTVRDRVGEAVRLDGAAVGAINSRLRAGQERADPERLRANFGVCFFGATPHGSGFFLDSDERARLVAAHPPNARRIFPYIGGEEINRDYHQRPSRFIINFGAATLEEAQQWPDLLSIVEERVRPFREQLRADSPAGAFRRKYWWRFAGTADDLRVAVDGLSLCLVTSQVSKHLCMSRQEPGSVFSKELCVFALDSSSAFAVLQSRPHEAWARLLCSSMRTDLRYSASDAFDTFPFPQPDPRTVIPRLEDLGERLYSMRARYMLDTQQGLTQTYNKLKDPACHDAPIVELRRLHDGMDRAVLQAYGWDDLAASVPLFCPRTTAEEKALEAFQDEVIDRLFVLNGKRAEEERLAGVGGGKRGKQAGRGKKAGTGGGAGDPGGQGSLGFG